MRYALNRTIVFIVFLLITLFCTFDLYAQSVTDNTGNKAERKEWFMNLALGMFIHWSVDSQLGSVISHSTVGASKDYLERYYSELPKTFYPRKFYPDDWARLARLAGMKYVVFTTKHFGGFCMWDTRTTDFSIMNTPYARDITSQIVEAFRRHRVHVGFYLAPEDNLLLYKQGHEPNRLTPESSILTNPELMKLEQAQLIEILTQYGPIEMLFIDGEAEGLKQLAWKLQPDIVVTRGEMETPEQTLPDQPMPGPWEACFTLGTQWAFKPTNESYKSGTELIEMLIETRAKGGNLLLNVGPTPEGEIPFEQERLLRELALWLFVNGESIYEVRPWHKIREGNIWFTRAKDSDTVYIFVTSDRWEFGKRKEITVTSVRATDKTEMEILGQSGKVLEYHLDEDPKTRWTQDEKGLHISAMRAQRLYNLTEGDYQWLNPVVIKMTHAVPVK